MNTDKGYLVSLTKILFLLLIIISPLAHSKFLVEPYYKFYNGDYETGGENGEYNAGSTISDSGSNRFKGGGIGSFSGFHFLDRWKIWTGNLNSALEPTKNRDLRYFG